VSPDEDNRLKSEFEGALRDGGGGGFRGFLKRIMKPAIVIAAALSVLLIYKYVFSPEAGVKHTIKALVRNFENKRVEETVDLISVNYHDAAGNTRESIGRQLPLVYDMFEKIDVEITELEIEFDDKGLAHATIMGRAMLTRGDGSTLPVKMDTPATFLFERGDDTRWRLYSVMDTRVDLENLMSGAEIF